MANRKKAKEAAIDFSVEMSTPAAPAKPAAKPAAKPKDNAMEILPGAKKAREAAAAPQHPRAAADRAKRSAEVASGIDEARMPKQVEAEAAGPSRYTPAHRAIFDLVQIAKASEPHPAQKAYVTLPVTPIESERASKISAGLIKPKKNKGRR